MGCGWGWAGAAQLFFMSLTGNSIPIKFTPFGRPQPEQGRVRETEGPEGGRQTRGCGLGPRAKAGSSLHCPSFLCGFGKKGSSASPSPYADPPL